MNYKESDFKKLGFKYKRGNKDVLEASAEIEPREYITVQLSVFKGEVSFLGIQVQGAIADQKRKEYLKKYSLQELDKYFIVFVDLPRAIGRNPDASGSRVPTYPALQ